jgi:hypothetical protein
MFRAIFALIIRSTLTVITAFDFIHACRCQLLQQPTSTHMNKTRSFNYSCDAPDDERKFCFKHVGQSRNNKLFYTFASFWSFCKKCIMMHRSMNVIVLFIGIYKHFVFLEIWEQRLSQELIPICLQVFSKALLSPFQVRRNFLLVSAGWTSPCGWVKLYFVRLCVLEAVDVKFKLHLIVWLTVLW